MTKLSLRLLCQIYLLLVLVALTILSPFPYSPLCLIMLLVVLFITFRPLYLRLNLVIIVAAIFLLPLAVELPLHYLIYSVPSSLTIVQIVAAMTILPVIYLLDYNLRQNAQNMIPTDNIKGRYITTVPQALFVSALAILLVSLILNNFALLFTSLILSLYLLAILIRVLYALPRLPLGISTVRKRIIAGTTAGIYLHPISKASIKLHGLFSPFDSWVKITPRRFTLNRDEIELELTITPPLAGPSHPQLRASVIDPWGFIQVNQVVEPVELSVIPRVRYAEWLAWKHSLKLNQLIVKEYVEAGEQVAIIAVNLSVSDAEEADKLAFNLITVALTLAQEAVPTALAVYNHQQVVLTTAITAPRETLRHTLSLVKDVTSVEFAHRFLQPPDIGKLKRSITLLKQATPGATHQLLGMLEFEFQAIKEATKNHPATLALLLATEHISPPAIIISLSQLNHDAEALPLTLDRLSKRGFTTIPIEVTE